MRRGEGACAEVRGVGNRFLWGGGSACEVLPSPALFFSPPPFGVLWLAFNNKSVRALSRDYEQPLPE